MPSYWNQLVEEVGIEGARAHMRQIRSKAVSLGFSSMDKEKHRLASQKGGKNRWKNRENKETDANSTSQEGLEAL